MVTVTGHPEHRRQVPGPAVNANEVDRRLLRAAGRTDLLQVLVDHDCPVVGRCPTCQWAVTSTRRECPSRMVALCLLERRPLPGWLVHLVGRVPGARTRRDSEVDRHVEREREDALPGLFEAPARRPERRRNQ